MATDAIPPAWVATTGVAVARASRIVLGRPSTLPASSTTDGAAATSAAASQPATWSWGIAPSQVTRSATRPAAARAQLAIEVAAAGQHQSQRGAARGE